MKLSLRWIFDHIKLNWKDILPDYIVIRFNQSVAEIEHGQTYSLDLDSFILGKVSKNQAGEKTILELPELRTECSILSRKDIILDCVYIIKKNKHDFSWA